MLIPAQGVQLIELVKRKDGWVEYDRKRSLGSR